MRTTLVLALMAALGCDDNSNNNGIKDMSMSVNKDLTALKTDCDVTMQDCGAGKKCVGQVSGSGSSAQVLGTCVADGTIAEGQACTQQQSNDTYLDNCKAGLVCDSLYGNQALVCRKICTTDSDCGAGSKCGDFTFLFPGWGWCAPTCTPFSAAAGNCAAGSDCGETVDDAEQPDPNVESGFFLCKKTGTGAAYATCTDDSDCGVNLWCGLIDQNTGDAGCLPNCDDTHMCASPGDAGAGGLMASCNPLDGQPGNAGWCGVQ